MKRYIRSNDDIVAETGEAIVDAWSTALKACDLYEEDIHCLSYNEVKKFKPVVERELRKRGIDLSGRSMVIPQNGEGFAIEGMSVGGNAEAIVDRLIRGCIKSAWGKVDPEEAIEVIKDAASIGNKIYLKDKFGYCDPVSLERALAVAQAGDSTQYSGQGSQSYIDETKVTVYEDYFGNVKVARTVARYD